MLNIHKKAFNTILLVLILILIIMTLNCIPFKDTIEGNTNQFYTNQDSIDAAASMKEGNETYMRGILKISEVDNKLIGAQKALSNSDEKFVKTETLRKFDVPGAQVFTMVNKNPNYVDDVDEIDEIYYLNSSSPPQLYKFAVGNGEGDQPVRNRINADADLFNTDTPVLLKYISEGYYDTYLLSITANNKVFTLNINNYDSFTQTWTPRDENILDKITYENRDYKISDSGDLYYVIDDDHKIKLPAGSNIKFIAIALDKNSHKLYALSNTSDTQSIYVFDFNDVINQDENIEASQITYSIFPLGGNNSYVYMALHIENSYMNDTNNKIYLTTKGTGNALYAVSLTYKGKETSENTNISLPKKIIDISTNINGLQIDNINNNIYIYSPEVYYIYPLLPHGVTSAPKTYRTMTENSIEPTIKTIADLEHTMDSAQRNIQTLNKKFNDRKTSLNNLTNKLNIDKKKIKTIMDESKGIGGNLSEQSIKFNMILIKYLFWILTAIITIILLALNYFAPDIISIEMIVVFAALMMIAVYLNRQYFDKYLDPIFSKLKTSFSSAISPLYTN